jgi:hypothetical protein
LQFCLFFFFFERSVQLQSWQKYLFGHSRIKSLAAFQILFCSISQMKSLHFGGGLCVPGLICR